MRRKIASIALTAVLSGAFAVAGVGAAQASTPAAAPAAVSQAAQRATAAPVNINQVLPDGSTLAGTFNLTKFVNQGGQLVAQGVFNGTLTSATGTVTQLTNVATSSVVTSAANPAACNILSLTLGPLHLDVLGLIVDLNQVNLNITAQPGSGNLLGNLLCNVARLLDNGTGLQGLTNLLNNLLGAL
ncbi:ABC transporter substrate-binding protein [Leifsonia sp. 2MCAF36]|uniref:ABC transporter substrate-binding protein n=1 Tax=Leifsonia sp. 2MCAF36 TaxID=3232988 RepID=UPI003F9A0303